MFLSAQENTSKIARNKEALEYHDNSIKNISFELSSLKTSENSINLKQKKFKENFNEKMTQIISKFNENDNNFEVIYENLGLEKVNTNKLDLSKVLGDINSNEDGPKVTLRNEEFKSFVEKTNNEIKTLYEQINRLKENDIMISNQKINEVFKTSLGLSSEKSSDFSDEIKEIQQNEKFIISTLFTKIGKDELEKAIKLLNQEIEKIVD